MRDISCPKCGAALMRHTDTELFRVYECDTSIGHPDGEVLHVGNLCNERALLQAHERVAELERELDSETEDEKRAVERIVALARENEQLRKRIAELIVELEEM